MTTKEITQKRRDGGSCVVHRPSFSKKDLEGLSIPSTSAIPITEITQKTALIQSLDVGEIWLDNLWTIWKRNKLSKVLKRKEIYGKFIAHQQ